MPREALGPTFQEIASKRGLEAQPQRSALLVESRSDLYRNLQETASPFVEVVEAFARARARDGTMRHEEAHESEVSGGPLVCYSVAQARVGRLAPYGETGDDAVPDEVEDPGRHGVGLEVSEDAARWKAALSEPTGAIQVALRS